MWTKSGRGTKLKCMVEISATQNYALVQQLAFFVFVCSAQLFLALQYYSPSVSFIFKIETRFTGFKSYYYTSCV